MLEKYPLLKLKLLGSICPCLEKEENCAARQAAWSLSSVQVRWHRKLRGASSSNGNTTSSSMGGFISGMFGGGSTGGGAAAGGGTYDPVKGATLSVVDAPTGPQLLISSSISSAGLRSKKIPLKCIKKVQTQKASGILNSSSSRSSIEIIDNTNREILRFDVLQSAGVPIATNTEDENEENWDNDNNLEDATEEIRDDIIDHLDIIIEWERRRQAYIVTLGEEDPNSTLPQYVNEYDDDDDNDNNIDGTPTSPKSGRKMGGALAEKAQSIKHFAEREIEMQKMKKEREARKAKYVKEAGGLKYTAIAMANRS